MEFDLAHLHEAFAGAFPERECLVWRDRRYSWQDIRDRTRRLANLLLSHGFGLRGEPDGAADWESPHDHVGLYLYNSPEYLEGLIGAHKARLAPFNVNYRYVGDELAYLFADARPSAIIYHGRFAPVLADVLSRLGAEPLLLQVADDSGHGLLPGALDYEQALVGASPELPTVEASPGDLHILYTGGTTGMPKGVLWRSADLLAGPLGVRRKDGSPCQSQAEVVDRAVASDRRVLPAPPFMHGSGTWFALGGWFSGATVVIQDIVDHLNAEDVVSVFERERITGTMVIGDAFARPLADEIERRGHSLPALRSVLNSGAQLSPAVKERLVKLMPQLRITDTLGSSETGPQATRRGAEELTFRPGPQVAVLSADFTRRLASGDEELGWVAQAGGVPRGYLGDPDKTAMTFRAVDGIRYAVPGDRGLVHHDGTIELVGRDSTTINSGGEKVFAEEVEAVVRSIAGVVDALVVGRPSERWGQEVVALVQLADGIDLDDDELRQVCAEHLARYKVPKAFVRVPQVRRQPNGKADYGWAKMVVA